MSEYREWWKLITKATNGMRWTAFAGRLTENQNYIVHIRTVIMSFIRAKAKVSKFLTQNKSILFMAYAAHIQTNAYTHSLCRGSSSTSAQFTEFHHEISSFVSTKNANRNERVCCMMMIIKNGTKCRDAMLQAHQLGER